jgi:hypothetical protein
MVPAAPTQTPGFHTHDGFYLQMDLGFGAMSSSADDPLFGEVELSGGLGKTGAFSIGLGYAVVPNFILAAHFWGAGVIEPDVSVGGQDLGSATDSTLSLTGVGLNLTYYFMPINIYVSVTPSLGSLTAEQGGNTSDSENGFAIRLAVGKEWWVSDNWGLGLNLQYAHSSNDDSADAGAPTWGTNWFGVAFSATYN